MITIGDNFISIPLHWPALRDTVANKRMRLQYVEDTDTYDLFAVDDPIVYLARIWRGTVPETVQVAYSQADNDTHRAEFEASYKATANASLHPTLTTGLPATTIVNVPEGASNLRKSYKVEAPPATVAISDVHIAGDLVGPKGKCYLIAGEYVVRTDAADGSALHFAIVDRDDVLGLFATYGLQRTRMLLVPLVAMPAVGDLVTGGTSGKVSRVLAVSGTTAFVTYDNGAFTDVETVTYGVGGSATLVDWIEGDVLEVTRYVKDEWVEGYDAAIYAPGGASVLPAGMYLRFIVYNAHATNTMRAKATIMCARE